MRWLLPLGLLLAVAGCIGAGRQRVTAATARYPISLSSTVRDVDGTLVQRGSIVRVGTFEHEFYGWSMLYGQASIEGAEDLSEAANAAIEKHEGEAIINLRVKTANCAFNAFSYVNPLALLPFWPGCVAATVTGEIIRVDRSAPPVAEPPANLTPLDQVVVEPGAEVDLQTQCAEELAESCLSLGRAAEGSTPGSAEAVSAYARACKLGNARGCLEAARMYGELGAFERAFELRERACSLGERSACNAR